MTKDSKSGCAIFKAFSLDLHAALFRFGPRGHEGAGHDVPDN